MQQQQNHSQPQPDNTGRMGAEQQQNRDQRETELHEGADLEGVSMDDDEDTDSEDVMAPDETEVGMDKEDYRDSETPGEKKSDTVGPDRSDRRL